MQDLHAKMSEEAMACLSLGLPATVSHIIDEQSPLANLSIQKMAARRMEVRPRSCLHACHDSRARVQSSRTGAHISLHP
jgi:hypothetical protein